MKISKLRKIRFYVILLLSCLTWVLWSCQSIRHYEFLNGYPKSWPHKHSDLMPDPEVVYGTLANGFRYVLMKNSTPEKRINMHLYVDAGSFQEKEDEQGIAHFLEHMLFCGSTHFKPGELIKFFQDMGVEFGPDANAHTGFFETVYDVVLPNSEKQMIEKGLMIIKDYAAGALLPESEIENERKIVLTEKVTRDSPSFRIFLSTLNFELSDTRLPKRFPIGIEETLGKINREQLKTFYETWYRPELMTLVMVGDFDISQIQPMVQNSFSDLKAKAQLEPFPDPGSVDHEGLKTFYHYEKDAGKTRVSIEVVQNNPFHLDSLSLRQDEQYRLMAVRIIQNRLDKIVREPGSPFTSASIFSNEYFNHFNITRIDAQCAPDKWETSLKKLEQTIRSVINHGFLANEIIRVQKEIKSEVEEAAEKSSTRESSDLSEEIIDNLSQNRVFLSPKQFKDVVFPFIESATPEILHETVKSMWGRDHRLVMVTGNASISNSSSDTVEKEAHEKILSVYQESVKTEVQKPEAVKTIAFPYLQDPQVSGTILRRQDIPEIGVTIVDFDNGVKLNLKKTDFEADTVKVVVSFGTGKNGEPAEKPGLGELTESVFNESGLGEMNKTQLETALTGTNTNVHLEVGENRFSLVGSSTSKQYILLFQLLYAFINDPAFRQDAYNLSIERYRQRYETMLKSVDGSTHLIVPQFLSGGDSRFGFTSIDNYQKLTIDDIRSWLEPSIRNDAIEISAVGDFDPDTLILMASKYFGSVPSRHHDPPLTLNRLPQFPKNKSVTHRVDTQTLKAKILIAYPTEDMRDINRTRRLAITAKLFSERIRERIREQMGQPTVPMHITIRVRHIRDTVL